jgi:O-antigen/teichoic acid export membrane protein
VAAEAVKNLAIYLWLRVRGLLVFRWERAVLREQLRLVLPLGLGSILNKANDFGRVVVGSVMGPVSLAIYSTAHYQVPVVNIVQTSLSDVIFPDLVKRAQRDPAEGLRLWKRAQMMVAAGIVPAWLLLSYFAEPLIRLAFTDAYVAATPYFQVFLLLMLRQCFQFSTLLRSVEDNASFATSSGIALALNVALVATLMPFFGLWGPTIGLVASQVWSGYYLGRRVMARYRVPASGLFHWRKLAWSLFASLLSLGLMHGALAWLPRNLPVLAAGLGLFCGVYALAARVILHEEYDYLMRAFNRRRHAT